LASRHDFGAKSVKPDRDIERRRVPNVVRRRLEGKPEYCDLLLEDIATKGFDDHINNAVSLAKVNRVDLLEERD
jgi:hypothetical protein